MEKEFSNKCVADAARAFEEKEEHKRVMDEIKNSRVKEVVHDIPDGNGLSCGCSDPYFWTSYVYEGISPKEQLYIAERGNVEEVVFMINHFANLSGVNEIYLPEKVQEVIAKRNNKTEVEALVKHYGFCCAIQMIILKEWSMDDLRWYIRSHGFDIAGQIYVFDNWDKNDVLMYLEHHKIDTWAQDSLFWRGDHDIIMSFLKNNYVGSLEFDIVFSRGNNEEIMFALERCSRFDVGTQKVFWI